jgi:hypothetical protein
MRTPPSPEEWQGAPLLSIVPPLAPPFFQHYEYRSSGPLGFVGDPVPETAGWIREQFPPSRMDAWWPAVLQSLLVNGGTVGWFRAKGRAVS